MPDTPVSPGRDSPTAGWRTAAGLFLAVVFGLRLVYAFRYQVNTDEPQHLHVAWAWTAGLVQYRDLFDNHAPLFHLAMAPVVELVGESPAIVFVGRLLLFPFFAGILWATWLVGTRLFDRRVALGAAVVTAVIPEFFFTSLEARADGPWAFLCLAAVVVLVGGPPDVRRVGRGGFLLGAALATSTKTLLLLAAVGMAVLVVRVLAPNAWKQGFGIPSAGTLLAGVAGFLTVPAAVGLFFVSRQAFGPMVEGLFGHNMVEELMLWQRTPWRLLPMTLGAVAVVMAVRPVVRGAPTPELGARRAVLLVALVAYVILLQTYDAFTTSQSLLPFYTLLVVLVLPLVTKLPAAWGRRADARSVGFAVATIGLVVVLFEEPVHEDHTWPQTKLLREVLDLTGPDEPVLDLKGQAIFRRRPVFHVFETVTRTRIRLGEIPDDTPERLIATHTPVTSLDSPFFPSRTRAFLRDNYLPVGRVRVAGKAIDANAAAPGGTEVTIAVPGRYFVVSPDGPVRAWIDGAPAPPPVFLRRGRHRVRVNERHPRLALLWARAVEKGYLPF